MPRNSYRGDLISSRKTEILQSGTYLDKKGGVYI